MTIVKNVVVLLYVSVFCFSCKKNSGDAIAEIQKNCTKINSKLTGNTRRQVDDLTSAGTGTISGYYDDDEIKKISAQHYTDTCRTFTDYYFDDGMLIFILKQNYVYNRPRTYTEEVAKANNDTTWYDDKRTKLEVSRFYFDKNKLIKWINPDKKEVTVYSPEFINKQSELWAETAILMKQLKEGIPRP
jgi:hypothetical protein